MPVNTEWVHSGGENNKNPNRDLGGAASQFKIATQPLNNLFDDVSPEELETGLIDYRCFYITNPNYNLHLRTPTITLESETPEGSNIEFGVEQTNEVQRLQFFGGTPDADGYLILDTEFGLPFKVNFDGSFAQMALNFEAALQLLPFCSTSTVTLTAGVNPYMDITFLGEAGTRKTQLIKVLANRLHSTQGGDFRIAAYLQGLNGGPGGDSYNGIGDVEVKVVPEIQDLDSFATNGFIYVFNPSTQTYAQLSYTSITGTDIFDLASPLTFNLTEYDELWTEPDDNKPYKVTISKITEGSPINQVAPIIPTDQTAPSGVVFGTSPLNLGNIFALEGFPVWIKRDTTAGVDPLRNDSFELSIQGTLFS